MPQPPREVLTKLLDWIADIAIVTDDRGHILLFNRAAEAAFGYTASEMIGRDVGLLADEPVRSEHAGYVRRYLETGEARIIGGRAREVTARRKDGTCFPAELAINETFIRGRRLFIGTLRDLSERKAAEAALREREALYKELVEMLPEAVFLQANEEGEILFANSAAARLLGSESESQLIGRHLLDFLDPAGRTESRARNRRVLAGQRVPLNVRGNLLRKDGTAIPIERSVVACRHRGRPALLSIVRNITDRLEAEAALRRSHQALTVLNALLSLVLKDVPLQAQIEQALDLLLSAPWMQSVRKGAVFLVEQPGQLALRVQRGLPEAVRSACTTVPFGHCLCGRAAACRKVQYVDGIDERHEARFPGMQAHGHCNVPILSSGRTLGVLMLYLDQGQRLDAQDLSFLRSAADALASLIERHRAEDELKRSEKSMRRARDQAELANRMKSEFLANMSHELRTPLNAIIGFSSLIADEAFGAIGTARYRDYAADILRSGQHLLEIIDDILNFSVIELGETALSEEQFSIAEPITACQRMIEPRMHQAGLALEVEVTADLPAIYADQRRLRQVLLNLLSNAAKFTPPGGTVRIVAHRADDGGLDVAVADTGIGMSEQEVEIALTPFAQVDGSLTRRHGGTGLGLPIAQALAALHGGCLSLDSEPGQGTRVVLHLPAERLHAGS